jgi:hypothetical protein
MTSLAHRKTNRLRLKVVKHSKTPAGYSVSHRCIPGLPSCCITGCYSNALQSLQKNAVTEIASTSSKQFFSIHRTTCDKLAKVFSSSNWQYKSIFLYISCYDAITFCQKQSSFKIFQQECWRNLISGKQSDFTVNENWVLE